MFFFECQYLAVRNKTSAFKGLYSLECSCWDQMEDMLCFVLQLQIHCSLSRSHTWYTDPLTTESEKAVKNSSQLLRRYFFSYHNSLSVSIMLYQP